MIELLVVIAIIALLLSIMMPALKMAKAKAEQVVCASHLKGIGLAVIAYLSANDDKFHAGNNNGLWRDWFSGTGDPLEYDSWLAYWGIAYAEYTDQHKIFECPSVKAGYVDSWIYSGEQFYGQTAEEVKDYFKYCGYGLNGYTNSYRSGGAYVWVKSSEFKRPSEIIFAQDHIEQKMDGENRDMFCIGPGDTINLTQWRNLQAQAMAGSISSADPSAFYNVVQKCFRHYRISISAGKGYSNTLWLDGHVSPIRQTDGEDVPVRWYTGENP